jgi:CHAD domain-containing protein
MALVPAARQAQEVAAQHQLRIAIKHYRYRMEILSSMLGAHYPELHTAVKGYQDVLGSMHDLDVFAGIVRESHFTAETEKSVLAAIAGKRGELFADFTGKLETVPIEKIGARVRSAW